jgi:hypothetical protein
MMLLQHCFGCTLQLLLVGCSLPLPAFLNRVPQHSPGTTNPAGGSTTPLPYALQLVPNAESLFALLYTQQAPSNVVCHTAAAAAAAVFRVR